MDSPRGRNQARPPDAGRDESLRPEDRITRGSHFRKIYGLKQSLHSRSFVVYHAPATGGRSRLGLTVSRKVGKAVQRNLAKRLLREIFRKNRHGLCQPLDLVINTRKSVLDAGYHGLEEEFRGLVRRLNRAYRTPPVAAPRGGDAAKAPEPGSGERS